MFASKKSTPGLKGMNCYDSMQRCPREPEIYLAIRHHSMPFLQKNLPPKPSSYGNFFDPQLTAEMEEKLMTPGSSNTALTAAKTCFKGATFIFIFPFYFLFCLFPQWAIAQLVPLLQMIVKNVVYPMVKPLFYLARMLTSPIFKLAKTIASNIKKIGIKISADIAAAKRRANTFTAPVVALCQKLFFLAKPIFSTASKIAFYPATRGAASLQSILIAFKIIGNYSIQDMIRFGNTLLNFNLIQQDTETKKRTPASEGNQK